MTSINGKAGIGSPVPSIEEKQARYMRYVKALDLVYREDEHRMKSLIRTVNLGRGVKEGKIRYYQDLAELMLEEEHLHRVLLFAENLLPPKTFATFRLAVLDSTMPEQALVKKFLSKDSLPDGCLFPPTSTLSDLIQFVQSDEDWRYFVVINEETDELVGIVSISDYSDHIDEVENLKSEGKLDMPVVELSFFNRKPKFVNELDSMGTANQSFEKAKKEKKKIYALLVVDEAKRPVGLLRDKDVTRWQAGSK